MVGGRGERLVEHCTFQNRNLVLVFLYHCISDGNRLVSENSGCHFLFILHLMSDKAAFESGALLCVQRYWENLNLHIYAATNSVSVWDYGITVSTAIHVIMLELKINKHNTYYRCTYVFLTSYLKRDLAKKKKYISLYVLQYLCMQRFCVILVQYSRNHQA